MVEVGEKSTATGPATARIHPEVILDSRLALFHEGARWLAVADIHYGYEISRRADGGLWPMWGMDTIEERFEKLLNDYEPETVIFAGDIVDGGLVGREAIAWLDAIKERCKELVLVAGNHDRGMILDALPFSNEFEAEGGFRFHHGHQPVKAPSRQWIEVTGHWHPSVTLHDGAGMTLKLPSLVQEREPGGGERWILPAFSPWAAGGQWRVRPGVDVIEWVCGRDRILRWTEEDSA